jgi:hypothetical protein
MVIETIDVLRNLTVLMVIVVIVVYWYYYRKFQRWSNAVSRVLTFVLVRPNQNVVQIDRHAENSKYILEVFFSVHSREGYWIRLESVTNFSNLNQLEFTYWISYYLRRKLGVNTYPLILDYIHYCYPLDTDDGFSQVLYEKVRRHKWDE